MAEDGTEVNTTGEKICEVNKANGDENGWEELMGQDLLLKSLDRPIAEGEEPVSVQPQDAVIVDVVGRLAASATHDAAADDDDDDGPIFHECMDWLLVVGEKDVVPALEMGIRFMQQGETAAIWSHPKYAYGPGERQWNDYTLPANSAVKYKVTLKRVVPSDEMERRGFLVRLCQSKKVIANDIFNHDDIQKNPYAKSRALHVYQRAAEMLDFIVQKNNAAAAAEKDSDDDDVGFDRSAARECLLDCLNNIAAVHLRCRSYHAAKQACVAVLEKDPANVKALLRAAKAALLDPASSYEEVEAAIAAAAEQCGGSPDDRSSLVADVERLRADLHRRKQAHQKKEKLMYSKMTKAATGTAAPKSSKDESSSPATGKSNNDGDKGGTGDAAFPHETSDFNPGGVVLQYLKALPWRRVILPYGVQLLMPLVMYYFFSVMRRNGRDVGTAIIEPQVSTTTSEGREEL